MNVGSGGIHIGPSGPTITTPNTAVFTYTLAPGANSVEITHGRRQTCVSHGMLHQPKQSKCRSGEFITHSWLLYSVGRLGTRASPRDSVPTQEPTSCISTG